MADLEKLDKLSLQISHSYLRNFFNKKIDNNMTGLISDLSSFKSSAAAPPTSGKLDLVKADELIASGLKKVRETGDTAVLQASIANQPEIFRIHRDILYTNMSRKQRIFSGVTQQLRKGFVNKAFAEVYL